MDESQPVAPPAPPPAADPRVDKLLEKISILEQLFVKRIKDDQAHAAAYNTLYQDMSKYRDDAFRGAQKPLLKGLVLLYDTMKRSLAGISDPPSREAVTLHLEELLELLHRHDVERIAEAPARFDRNIQQALGTEPAASAAEDQTVARVVRDGFRWGAQVLRPQEVVIRVHKQGE
jgi:molecular chaperone GrpE (heat shock protein)